MAEITLTSGYGTGLTPKQKTAFQRPYSTGSLVMNDGDSVRDASGDDRITFTDGGTLVLEDEDGNAGITLERYKEYQEIDEDPDTPYRSVEYAGMQNRGYMQIMPTLPPELAYK